MVSIEYLLTLQFPFALSKIKWYLNVHQIQRYWFNFRHKPTFHSIFFFLRITVTSHQVIFFVCGTLGISVSQRTWDMGMLTLHNVFSLSNDKNADVSIILSEISAGLILVIFEVDLLGKKLCLYPYSQQGKMNALFLRGLPQAFWAISKCRFCLHSVKSEFKATFTGFSHLLLWLTSSWTLWVFAMAVFLCNGWHGSCNFFQ